MAASQRRRPAVNARFRTRRSPSGVDYYAAFLVARIECDEIRPGRFWSRPGLSELWEQFVLPVRTVGRPLISPCNTGPILKRRQLLVVHDIAPLIGPAWFSRLYRLKAAVMTKYLFPRVAVAATVSKSSAVDLAQVSGRDDICVLPNVPARRTPSRPPSAAIAHVLDRPFVLSVSNLEPRKNLSTLVRAWERVEGTVPSGVLAIVGAAGAAAFGDVSVTGGSPRMCVLGRIDDSDIAHLLDHCSAVVTIPLYEGFGRVLVEGLLHGAPVIASDIAAHREVVAGSVTFVDPTDEEAIAAALHRALTTGRVDQPPPELSYEDTDLDRELRHALTRLLGCPDATS